MDYYWITEYRVGEPKTMIDYEKIKNGYRFFSVDRYGNEYGGNLYLYNKYHILNETSGNFKIVAEISDVGSGGYRTLYVYNEYKCGRMTCIFYINPNNEVEINRRSIYDKCDKMVSESYKKQCDLYTVRRTRYTLNQLVTSKHLFNNSTLIKMYEIIHGKNNKVKSVMYDMTSNILRIHEGLCDSNTYLTFNDNTGKCYRDYYNICDKDPEHVERLLFTSNFNIKYFMSDDVIKCVKFLLHR